MGRFSPFVARKAVSGFSSHFGCDDGRVFRDHCDRFVFGEQVLRAVRRRRKKREIDKLKDHYVICGCGIVGKEVALEMKRARVPFVIVEQDPEKSELGRNASVAFVRGDAT